MIPSLIYLDRYCNEGTRTYSQHAEYTEAWEAFRPNSKHPQFDLAAFSVPREYLHIYTANPAMDLESIYLGNAGVLFCIHPQIMEEHPDDPYIQQTFCVGTPLDSIPVSPSSSTRTLYVRNSQVPHAVKVHFPFRISRYGRRMRHEVLAQAVHISLEIERGIHHLGDRFAFLREVIGVAYRNLRPDSPRGENWGYLVRDMRPFPTIDEQRFLIPGFSLYGKDFFNSGKPPLLFYLMGDRDPKTYVLENIMLPIIRHWVACFQNFGYLLEPHGQNVILEVGADREIKRIVHRDLSLGIDMRRRRELRLPDGGLNDYNRLESGEFHSITYDKFMGSHFFDRIVALCREKYPYLVAEDFRKPCREEFVRIFPDHAKYLPASIRYFSEDRDQFGKPLYQDTGIASLWRP
jgi:IucA / IucC family